MNEDTQDKGSNPNKVYNPGKIWYYLFLVILVAGVAGSGLLKPVKSLSWKQFQEDLLVHKAVERIEVVNGEKVQVYLKPTFQNDPRFKEVFKQPFGGNPNPGPHYTFTIGSIESFERRLDEARQNFPSSEEIPVNYIKGNSWLWNISSWILTFILFFLLWNYLIRKGGGWSGSSSIFNFGKSRATLIEKEKSNITFEDVAGMEEAEFEIREIVEFLKNPGAYTKLGAKIPKGIILVGPPGTGKTLLAKAVAGEAQVPFFTISGSEFVEMFVGVGASRVRDLFNQAKLKAPCIIFIDEIDAIGRSRGKGAFLSGANDERESTLNQLLTEMDGFGTNTGVIVLAATNRADMLDPALLRPGRFDRHIYLELPNQKEREEIFKVHLRPLVTDVALDTSFLAAQTPGFSGADIANICNEAALLAARRKEDKINTQDFMDALDRVITGLEKKSKIISPAEKKIIAFHEAGHALVSWMLPNSDPLVKVSIIPRGKSLGAAWYLPAEKQLRRESAFKDQLCTVLAGRASEEITFGEVSSGALDDLEKVTREAYQMIAYLGFNKKLGNISFYDSTGQNNMSFQKPYSEDTGRLIDEEVRKLIDESYQTSKAILVNHRDALNQVAQLLLEKETIYKEDLERILSKRNIPNR